MNQIPFVLKTALSPRPSMDTEDGAVYEEGLPASLTVDAMGLVYNRGTRITDVKQETSDEK